MTKPVQNPALRFKNKGGNPFPDWEEKRLGDVAKDIYQPQTISQADLISDGEYLVYGANGIIGRYDKYNHELNQVIITCRGSTCGEITYTVEMSWITGNSMVINLDGKSDAFKKLVFYRMKATNWKYIISGSGQPQITGNIKEHKTTLPKSSNEQKKIADFLTAMDDKIDALTRKRDQMEIYKRGLMQQLFSQKIRFKNANGKPFPDWEEKRLGDVGKLVTGKTPPTENKALWGGRIAFITPTDISDNMRKITSTQRTVAELDKYRILPIGAICFTCIASIGKICITSAPSITNQQINSVIIIKPNRTIYTFYAIKFITPKIKALQANTTLPIINKTEFSKFRIPIPHPDEQKKIADFLTAMDDKIDALTRQRDQMETFKRALMQKMFV